MFLLAKYNTQTSFIFPIVKRAVVDLAATADWTPATGDTKVSKDGGNVANTTNNPAAAGGTGSVLWTLTLTATELSAAEVVVQIVDSATKAIEDQTLRIYTYGNASAKIPFDLSTATQTVLLSAGTGTGQLDFTSGVVKSNLAQILGTALTETSGLLAGGFKKFFNVSTPTGTVNSIPDAVAGAASGLAIVGSNMGTVASVTGAVASIGSGGITRASFAAETGLQTNRSNTAQAGSIGSITLDAGASATDSFYKGAVIKITGGTGAGQERVITVYTGATKVAALDRLFVTAPDNTSTFAIYGQGPLLSSSLEVTASAVTGSVGSVTGSVGGNLVGNVNGSVGSVTAAVTITAASVQAIWDALTSALTTVGSIGKLLIDNINATISSRLASASYTTPPTVSAIATQVRTELTTELGRVDVSVSSVKNRLSTLVTKTATVQTDAGNSATQILTDLTETEVDHWAFALVKITSGTLAEQVRKCTGYDGAGTLTFTDGFTATPADGVTLELVND